MVIRSLWAQGAKVCRQNYASLRAEFCGDAAVYSGHAMLAFTCHDGQVYIANSEYDIKCLLQSGAHLRSRCTA